MNGRLFDAGEALFEVNPSKLQTWLNCPRRYRYMYVERRMERRSSPHATLGRCVHIALREFFAEPPADRCEESLICGLRRVWENSGFRSGRESGEALARAETMLRTYLSRTDPRSVRTIALESKFALPRSEAGILITGRIDRLDADADGYVIVDYKTGRFRQDAASVESSLALSLYAMAVSWRLGRRVSRIEVHHLALGERTRTVRGPRRLERDWELLRGQVARMRSESEFSARPGPLCRGCHFLDVCRPGREHVGVTS